MTDETSAPATKPPTPRKKLLAMLATVVLIAGGITLTSMSVANANAEETARLCAVTAKDGARATTDARASVAAADVALEATASTTLPGDAGTSTSYADRPAVEAVASVETVEARPSGAVHLAEVATARAALEKIRISTRCTDRDQVEAITTKVAKTKTATEALDTSIVVLTDDFAVFQAEESARIAAEIEAARVAAEIEAARVAAEAAAAETARVAAERAAAEAASDSDYNDTDYSSGGSSSGGGGRPNGGGGSSGTPGGGGGQVGSGGNTGPCRTYNGMGGTMPC